MARPQVRPTIEAPTLAEIEAAEDYLYPNYTGLYTHEQRTEINRMARELMHRRLKRRDGVH